MSIVSQTPLQTASDWLSFGPKSHSLPSLA
jgi:hypothetical protein